VSSAPENKSAARAFFEAEQLAEAADQRLSTAHLLLGIFSFENEARRFLEDRDISDELILEAIRVIEPEPPKMVQRLRDHARRLARGGEGNHTTCLHILIAMAGNRDCFAYCLLERCCGSITGIRNQAMRCITGRMPRSLGAPDETRPRVRTMLSPRNPRQRGTKQTTGRPPEPSTEVSEGRPSRSRRPVTNTPEPAQSPLGGEKHDEFSDVEAAVRAAAAGQCVVSDTDPAGLAAPQQGARLNLAEIMPTLFECGRNLTALAADGGIDPAVCREREISQLIDILGKRRSNNPILVGPPGVGKTAIVEGLALLIASSDPTVDHISDRVVFSLDTGALVAGTGLRGAFSERMKAIKTEVAANASRVMVFIDEIHTLIGAGQSGDSAQDAANELKTGLARGEFPCIGATTDKEYRQHIEKDPALERRFTPIEVVEPTEDEAILIVEGAIGPYAAHHRVRYTLEALHAAVRLSNRFIPERKLPAKAIEVVDLAGSRARRCGAEIVERLDIAQVVHQQSGVPLERLADTDIDRFSRAEELIGEHLIGHQQAVKAVCEVLRRGFAGFNSERPLGSFVFLGPTGVGKTELVKVLAGFLFGSHQALCRFDMSEYSEKHAVARMVGAGPGYVGYEDGGQLTEALRKRPFQVVLFDEVEKAHPDVLNILLQILDEGHLTDGRGRRVSFSNTLVIMTSNLGAKELQRSSRSAGIGFGGGNAGSSETASRERVEAALSRAREFFPAELWGRIDEHLVFAPLVHDEIRQIAELQLRERAAHFFAEREVTLAWSPEVLTWLTNNGGMNMREGARGMRKAIQHHVEEPVSRLFLAGQLLPGSIAEVSIDPEGGDDHKGIVVVNVQPG